MKRIAFAVSLVILVLGVAILAKTQTGSVEQELIKLENEWGDAYVMHDATTFGQMVTDDFIGTMSDGTVYTKAQALELVKSYKGDITFFMNDEWKVRVYGDAAVVTARNTFKMQLEGEEIAGQGRFTDTWIRRDGRWKCAAAHNSDIPQKLSIGQGT